MLQDQIDLLSAFNAYSVKYVVIGGHAVGFHSEPRGTKDLDVLIESSRRAHRTSIEHWRPLAHLWAASLRKTS